MGDAYGETLVRAKMKESGNRNIEIHRPGLAQRLAARIQVGPFHDTDELIEKALDALDERTAPAPTTAAGAGVLAALQARPPGYRLDAPPPAFS